MIEQGSLALLVAGVLLASYWANRHGTAPKEVAGAASATEPDSSRQASIPAGDTGSAAATSSAAADDRAAEASADTAKDAAPAILTEAKNVEATLPAAEPTRVAEAKPAASFRDERPALPTAGVISTAAAAPPPAADAPLEGAAPVAEVRPFEAPSFQDRRPIAMPSFRDTRPTAPGTFRDGRPIPAKEEKPADPKPFEVGYYLADRSPMIRAMEDDEPQDAQRAPQADKAAAPAVEPAAAPSLITAKSDAPAPAAAAPEAAVSGSLSAGGADGPLPTLVALAPGSLKIDGTACSAPDVATEALDGGMMRMRISANCRPNEFVQISYGGAEFIRKLSSYGALDFTLDAFAGTSSAVEVRFADGTTKSLPVVARDLDKVSKIAVSWRTGVNLDLHVFEYAAKLEQPGHLWARTPSAMITAKVQAGAQGRGHGFLSMTDDEKSLGDKLEVYTFFHNDQQTSGAISLALDNETRGETPSGATCGQGALAEIDFQVSILPRNGQVSRQNGVLTRVECGTRLTAEARFNHAAMPGLRIRK